MTRQLCFFDNRSMSWHHKNNNTAHFKGGLWSWGRRGSEREHETGYDTFSFRSVNEPVGGHCSIPKRGLTPHANAPRHHNQLHIVKPAHTQNAPKTRATVAFRVSSVRVTPGNRGRRFSRFLVGKNGTGACWAICWQGQSRQKWPLWKLTPPAWDNFNDLLVEATLLF